MIKYFVTKSNAKSCQIWYKDKSTEVAKLSPLIAMSMRSTVLSNLVSLYGVVCRRTLLSYAETLNFFLRFQRNLRNHLILKKCISSLLSFLFNSILEYFQTMLSASVTPFLGVSAFNIAPKIFSKSCSPFVFKSFYTKSTILKTHNIKKIQGNLSKSLQSFRQTVTLAPGSVPIATQKASKYVGTWLVCCSGMVVGSVVLGGITRLTKSGLSMVDWHLFKEFPPMNKEQWQLEFEKYKQYPEYKQCNANMTLEEFKWIWFMEYGHRMWGRAVGAVFLFPAIYFWKKRWLTSALKKRVLIFGSLILSQGLLGWYMVKSGLVEKPESDDVTRVSQYRLAAHLGMAFVVYSLMLWSGLSLLLPPQPMEVTKSLLRFRKFAHGAKGLIFLTAFSGAFVAGIEAGLVYNTFPKMADRWIPSDIAAFTPKWKNITENPTTTQFNHRILGETVFCIVTALWWKSRSLPLSPRARLAMNCMFGMALMQVTLGITTLLTHVHKHVAATHQSGALALLSTAIWLTHELKLLKLVPK